MLKSEYLLDGVAALEAVLVRAGYPTIPMAVAAHAVYLDPDTVQQTHGRALFQVVRDASRRGTFGNLHDGRRVMYDDNYSPAYAFMWAAGRMKRRDTQFNHLWVNSQEPDLYTALWNMCLTPAFLARTTDAAHHHAVIKMLRYRSYELYGYLPAGREPPERPADYPDEATWPAMPGVANLEEALRAGLARARKGRAAVAASQLGWLFSGWVPDQTLSQADIPEGSEVSGIAKAR